MSDLSGSDNNPLSAATTHRLRVGVLILVVIAAIVLAAVLVHRQRVTGVRSQVGAGIATADGVRVAVAIYHARTGAWPPDNIAAGLLSPSAVEGKYVGSVQIDEGRILITLGGQIDEKLRGNRIELTPYLDGALVRWRCGSTDIAMELLPENCR